MRSSLNNIPSNCIVMALGNKTHIHRSLSSIMRNVHIVRTGRHKSEKIQAVKSVARTNRTEQCMTDGMTEELTWLTYWLDLPPAYRHWLPARALSVVIVNADDPLHWASIGNSITAVKFLFVINKRFNQCSTILTNSQVGHDFDKNQGWIAVDVPITDSWIRYWIVYWSVM